MYKITDKCIKCETCVKECPVSAIEDNGKQYEINKDACVQCGNCYSVCPQQAIVEE